MPASLGQALNSYQNTGASEVNANALGTLEPYVTTMTAPVAPVQQYNAASTTPSSQGGMAKFGHFLGGLATGVGHLAEGAAKWIATNSAHMVTAVPREVIGIRHGYMDNNQINWQEQRTQQNSNQLNALYSAYHDGHISKAQYQDGLKGLIASNNQITKDEMNLINKVNSDKTNAYKAMIDSAATVVTIMTAGVGDLSLMPTQLAEKTAADYLGSTNANAFLGNVESALNHFATNPEAFGQLSKPMQAALQRATAEVMAQSSKSMTAAQIARATAANFALKYPLYYNYLSTTGHQIYQELDQQKYGQAVRTIAFNALLALSGGPIGQAMKYGGKAIGGVVDRTFNRTPFIDELSRGIGNGSPDGIYKAVRNVDTNKIFFFQATGKDAGKLVNLPETEARDRMVQNLKALRAINLNAVKGKDETAAAWRVLNGMNSYEGLSMRDVSHEDALINMVHDAEAMRVADFYGTPGKTVVGRVDARDKNQIFTGLAPYVTDKQTFHEALDSLIAENTNRPWANNTNFVRQVRALGMKYNDPEAFRQAGENIKASFAVEGFPKSVAEQMTKLGYLPIEPTNLEAPFREGSAEKLTSQFANQRDFFQKAVAPIPVLKQVGSLFEHMGLSPLAAESRSYEMYNAALGERLSNLGFLDSTAFKGDSPEHTADNTVKALSDWVRKFNSGAIQRGGISLGSAKIRPPIQDLRQLLAKDTAAALQIPLDQAKLVNKEIRNAMLDVPFAVRGLGDKVVDVMNNIPLFRSYLRVQGAGRFSWNPVFQGKLATKTEFASQALSGGQVPVVLQNILGRGPAIESTRGLLRDAGIFDAQAATLHEAAAGGEAVSEGTAVGANLTHKLLPIQEKSIAGMVNKMASKVGLSPQEFVQQFPDQVRDTTYMIAQYDRRSEFLHSPLMRTLNFAIFPFRFEYKVASIMAKSLAQTDTLTQVAVINGLMNAHAWLNSPEGMTWYSQNANALKFINYFSPTYTLATVGTLLNGVSEGDWHTMAGAFELGGLPFGWIPQILNNEGANFLPGYVDPATGKVLANQIPNTSKAQLQVAIGDLIGALYTYPGAELGMPSKTSVDKFIAGGLVGGSAKKSGFTPTQPPLSQQQQRFSQTIQGLPQNQQANATVPATAPTKSATIQATGSGTAAPRYTAAELRKLSRAAKQPKLKKGQFKAQLPS